MDRPSGSSADPGVGGRSTLSPEAEAEIERLLEIPWRSEGGEMLAEDALRAAMQWAWDHPEASI